MAPFFHNQEPLEVVPEARWFPRPVSVDSFFRSLSEQSGDGVFVKGLDLKYLYANPAGARLLGRTVDEIVGRDDFEFFPPETARRMAERDARIIREGSTRTQEDEGYMQGRRVVVQTTKSPHRDAFGVVRGLVCVARDVTEQRVAFEERNRLIQELERERQIRESLVAGFGHDLRSPLTAARVTAQAIERQVEPSHPVLTMSARIVRALDRADRMIRNLLDGSRLGAGEQLRLERSFVNLGEILEECLGGMRLVHGERFHLVTPDEEIIGYWDRDAVSRTVENLASNAIKYGSPGAVITVQAGQSREENTAWFSVHNQGDPIPPNEQAELYSLFRRAPSMAAQAKGWGIGLAIVKGLSEALGGRVELESRVGWGTRFTVRLPLGPEESPAPCGHA